MTTAAQGPSGPAMWDERMAGVARAREDAYKQYLWSVDMQRRMLDDQLKRLDRQHKQLVNMRDDRIVLVRQTAGPDVTTYHSAERPCGRVNGRGRSLSSFKRVLEGEAKADSLHRCTACTW